MNGLSQQCTSRPRPLVHGLSPIKKAAGIYPYVSKLPTDICPPLFCTAHCLRGHYTTIPHYFLCLISLIILNICISTVGTAARRQTLISWLWVSGVTENRFCINGTNMTIPNSTTPAANAPRLYQLDEEAQLENVVLAATVESVEQTGQGQGCKCHSAGCGRAAGSGDLCGRRSWYRQL